MPSVNWSSLIAAHLNLDAETTTRRGALLAEIGASVQDLVETTIGRTFEARDYVEAYNGSDRDFLFLRHDPIISVSRVTVNGSEVAVADLTSAPVYPPPPIVVDAPACIRFTSGNVFPAGVQNVVVEYRAGYRVAPPALVRACVAWAALIFKNRERIGLVSQSAGGQSTSFSEEPPDFVRAALTAYTRWGNASC